METRQNTSQEKRSEGQSRYPFFSRYTVPLAIACLGIVTSAYLFLTAREWEEMRVQSSFERVAANHVSAIKESINNSIHSLDAVVALFDASEKVERSEFRIFARHLLEHVQGFQAIEWIPRVPHAKRAAYEEAARREGYPAFQITERKATGVLVRAARRGEYFPVYFIEPYEGNEAALGFDLASEPSRRVALWKSRDGGKPTATGRITLVQETGEQFAFLIYYPVYDRSVRAHSVGARRRNLKGFALGVLRVKDLIEQSIAVVAPRAVDVYVYDESAEPNGAFLYCCPASGGERRKTLGSARTELLSGLHYAESIDVTGRQWRVICIPTPEFVEAGKTWQPWGILVAGLLLTTFAAGFLVEILSRAAQTRQHAADMEKAKEQLEREVIERRAAEAIRRTSEMKLEEAQKVANMGSWEWDIARDRVTWSNELYRIYGVSPEEFGVTNEAFWEFVHPDDREIVEIAVKNALSQGAPFAFDHRIVRKDGTERMVHSRGEAGFDDRGTTVFIRGTVQDITEHKILEEELLKIEKLESLGVLAGGLAHDFNNLLTAILGNINLALMYVDPQSKAYERLAEAEKGSLRAGDLTQQLLTFSKGGVPIRQPASIQKLIQESASFALRGSNTKYELGISDDLWTVEVDIGQLHQVINNLMINADQAMPQGGTITIRCENVSVHRDDSLPLEQGNYVKISIQDQGAGITEDHLQRIFDPYFTTKQQGSGLGLATAYSVVKRHGGHITVESLLGSGTAFHLYLPTSEEELPEEVQEEAILHGTGKILLMDDEDLVRDIGSEMLESLGYSVALARDGTEAIELYTQAQESGQPFDAIILDLTVPGGMGGLEAFRKLRELNPGLKAIVSSGYANDPIMAEHEKYGFCDVLTKPYKTRDVSVVLKRVLTYKRA